MSVIQNIMIAIREQGVSAFKESMKGLSSTLEDVNKKVATLGGGRGNQLFARGITGSANMEQYATSYASAMDQLSHALAEGQVWLSRYKSGLNIATSAMQSANTVVEQLEARLAKSSRTTEAAGQSQLAMAGRMQTVQAIAQSLNRNLQITDTALKGWDIVWRNAGLISFNPFKDWSNANILDLAHNFGILNQAVDKFNYIFRGIVPPMRAFSKLLDTVFQPAMRAVASIVAKTGAMQIGDLFGLRGYPIATIKEFTGEIQAIDDAVRKNPFLQLSKGLEQLAADLDRMKGWGMTRLRMVATELTGAFFGFFSYTSKGLNELSNRLAGSFQKYVASGKAADDFKKKVEQVATTVSNTINKMKRNGSQWVDGDEFANQIAKDKNGANQAEQAKKARRSWQEYYDFQRERLKGFSDSVRERVKAFDFSGMSKNALKLSLPFGIALASVSSLSFGVFGLAGAFAAVAAGAVFGGKSIRESIGGAGRLLIDSVFKPISLITGLVSRFRGVFSEGFLFIFQPLVHIRKVFYYLIGGVWAFSFVYATAMAAFPTQTLAATNAVISLYTSLTTSAAGVGLVKSALAIATGSVFGFVGAIAAAIAIVKYWRQILQGIFWTLQQIVSGVIWGGLSAILNTAASSFMALSGKISGMFSSASSSAVKATTAVATLGATTKTVQKEAQNAWFAFKTLLGPVAMFGVAAGAVYAIGEKLKGGFDLAGQMEQNEVAFEAMFRSADKAKKIVADITAFSQVTPFQLPDLIEEAKKLAAFGVAQEQLVPTLKTIGDLAMGDSEKMGRLAQAYGSIKVIGIADMEKIKSIAEAGIPIFDELAKVVGKPREALREMVERGQIQAAHIQQAFKNMTSAGGQFANGTQRQSETVNGLLSTLRDNVNIMWKNIADGINNAVSRKDSLKTWIALTQAINTYVVPMIVNGVITLVNFIRNGFTVVSTFIKANIPYFIAFGGIAVAVFGMVRQAVNWWATAFTNAIVWVINLFAGGGVKSIADFGAFLLKTLIATEFYITNWKTVLSLGVLYVMGWFANFAASLEYYFGTVAPAYLGWFGQNWVNVFQDMSSATLAIVGNLFTNLKNNFQAIWAFIKSGGSADLALTWTPLLTGFKATVEALPKIAEQQVTTSQQVIRQTISEMQGELSGGLQQYMSTRLTEIQQQTAATDLNMKTPEIPQPQIAELQIDPLLNQQQLNQRNGLGRGGGGGSGKEKTEIRALELGTAEAFSAAQRASNDANKHTRDTARNTATSAKLLRDIDSRMASNQPVQARF